MQAISLNPITQGKHGPYNAVDYDNSPDPDSYAPEDGVVTLVDSSDNDSCGKRLKLKGNTGEHGFCHIERFYVTQGQSVKRGQRLFKMGYTGYTEPPGEEGAHAHQVLEIDGVWVYPPSKINQTFIKLEEETMTFNQMSNLKRITGLGSKATDAEFNKYKDSLSGYIDYLHEVQKKKGIVPRPLDEDSSKLSKIVLVLKGEL